MRLLGVEYFDITYLVYDEKYCEIVKPIVAEICGSLKPLDLKNDDGCCQDKDVSMGTTLFELYLAVKQFSDLSSKVQGNTSDLCIHGTFHNWFHTTVAQWLDIAWFKAMNRIRRAVQLDTLKPLDDFNKITTSAVDTASIFHQIEIFWNQLSWPEVEGSYSFIAKILDDLCRCTIFYADLMCKKVEEMEKIADEKYHISDELCFAINNIERVAEEMQPISEKLGMNSIIEQLGEKNGPSVADQCRRTLITVMENANENINNKIIDILEKVGLKMRPVIQKLLLEGSETDSEEYGVEKLVKYLDKNLIKLNNKLTPATFDKVFAIIWENASVALRYLINTNIEVKRRPPSFFKQIHQMLQILINFFYPEGPAKVDLVYNSNIQEIEKLIGFYGASSTELILKYYQDRHKVQSQKTIKNSDLGSLTIRAHYCEDIRTLRVELLNARNLKPHDANGQCDPYVKVKLVPKEFFPSAPIFKTKIKKKTLFPLFDEIFSVPLSPDELSTGGIIMFTLKDHDLFGRNDFLGECFLPLESIPFTTSDTKLQDLPQKLLPMTLPKDPNSITLQTLESRQWDRSAAEFVKKERTKMIVSPNAQQ
ncbi:Protein unc-13 D [Orchesella cincta]|uniref:Protein unc-13 D n=1 Tax=Orchesella cincta TaxID=48709 RepID=A0A1D2NK22_ORCCI|nr:Protein unc-13 D [Orchesella cincta]